LAVPDEFVPPHIAPLIDRHANSLLQMLLHWYRVLKRATQIDDWP
jgi:hypothetical protein